MCPIATAWGIWRDGRLKHVLALAAAISLLAAAPGFAQTVRTPDWRRLGNTVMGAGLASPAGGPVDRVWYDPTGDRLFAQTASGRVFETQDFEEWSPSEATPPPPQTLEVEDSLKPEAGARLYRAIAPGAAAWYAIGRFLHSSSDSGRTWTNLTGFQNMSILGEGLTDLALSPRDGEEIAAAGRYGVWRSLDGGLTWSGLNESLPNLPAVQLAGVPSGARPARLVVDNGDGPVEVEWDLIDRSAWLVAPLESSLREAALRGRSGALLNAPITAAAESPDHQYQYAGSSDGRLWASANAGANWQQYLLPEAGTVTSIHVVAYAPDLALATVLPLDPASAGPRVFRTMNAGGFWDDITADLPAGAADAVAADLASGTIYVATASGLYLTYTDLRLAPPATPWIRIPGLPDAPVVDVGLDPEANQIYAVIRGYGLYAAMAPHRFRDPRLVNAADSSDRAVAPGTLLSVLGAQVSAARAGNLDVPILAASGARSEIQVPFEADGSSLSLALLTGTANDSLARRTFDVPLLETSPAIFVDRDGLPMVVDADRGILLDGATPARPGMRIQILATGLGRVQPNWPSGRPAPRENPPSVVAPVRAFLNGLALDVTRATLAPDYVGFYLIEVRLPDMLPAGIGELFIDAAGQSSPKVSLFTLP